MIPWAHIIIKESAWQNPTAFFVIQISFIKAPGYQFPFCLQEQHQDDAQSVEPDSQFPDDDDDLSINLSEEDGDAGGDSSGEGDQGGELDDEEHLPPPEASQVVCQQSPDAAESPCDDDSQPSSPVPVKMFIEIPDTPGPENQNNTVDEDVKETHLRKRSDLEGKIQALSLKLNTAKKMYASQISGYNYVLFLHSKFMV